jgi:hypothetical protein
MFPECQAVRGLQSDESKFVAQIHIIFSIRKTFCKITSVYERYIESGYIFVLVPRHFIPELENLVEKNGKCDSDYSTSHYPWRWWLPTMYTVHEGQALFAYFMWEVYYAFLSITGRFECLKWTSIQSSSRNVSFQIVLLRPNLLHVHSIRVCSVFSTDGQNLICTLWMTSHSV